MPPIKNRSDALVFVAIAIPFAGVMSGLFLGVHQHYPALDSLVVPIGFGAVPLIALQAVALHLSKRGSRRWLDARALVVALLTGLVDLAISSMWVPYLNGALDFGESTTAFGTVEEIAKPSKNGPRRRLLLEDEGPPVEFYPDPYWSVGNVRSGGRVRLKIGRGAFGARYVRSFADGA